MKKLYKTLLVILIANLGYSQTSKIIHNVDGLSVIYLLSKIGNQVNSDSGTNFTKYNLHLIVKNSSSKYWAYHAINGLSSKNLKSGILNSNDERFMRNGGLSKIDHFSIEDNCFDFPRYNSVAAPHQVICPGGIQECEKTFLYPNDVAGEPEIEWASWGFTEMQKEQTTNMQNTILSKNTIGQSKKVITTNKNDEIQINKVLNAEENYQLGMNYYNGLKGFSKDFTKARFYFEKVKSNDVKEASAACNLGDIYTLGNGVAVDKIFAKQYYKRACDLGHHSGCLSSQ